MIPVAGRVVFLPPDMCALSCHSDEMASVATELWLAEFSLLSNVQACSGYALPERAALNLDTRFRSSGADLGFSTMEAR